MTDPHYDLFGDLVVSHSEMKHRMACSLGASTRA